MPHAIVLAATMLTLQFFFAAAQSATLPEHAALSEAQRVLATEKEYVAAEIRRDEAALQRLIDERFVFKANDGTRTDKDAFIRRVLAMCMVGQTIRERTLLVEGKVALVFGTAELRVRVAGRGDAVSALRYTAAYVKRDDQWRIGDGGLVAESLGNFDAPEYVRQVEQCVDGQ